MAGVIIIGCIGNCLDIADAARAAGQEVIGFLDDGPGTVGSTIYGAPLLGGIDSARSYPEAKFVCGIGGPNSHRSKLEIIARTGLSPDWFATVVDPSASISPSAEIGAGTVLLANVSVAANARLGHHVMFLQNGVVGHDSVIGDGTVAAAGVVVSGGVSVGLSCYLGAGCTIRDGVKLGDGAFLAMGAVLVTDMPAGEKFIGVPAHPL